MAEDEKMFKSWRFIFVFLLVVVYPMIASAACSWVNNGTSTAVVTTPINCNVNIGDGTFQSNWDFQLFKTGTGPRIIGIQTSGTYSDSRAALELSADHQGLSVRAFGSGFTQFKHANIPMADWATVWSDGVVPGTGKGLLIGTGGPYVSGAPIVFATNGSARMIILGNSPTVGINFPYPPNQSDPQPNTAYVLDVRGGLHASSIASDVGITAVYQDVAEWVPATEHVDAGTVVVLNRDKKNEVTSSSKPYDTTVAGVVSERPGISLGKPADGKVQVATTGRVRVKVDARRAAIQVGDLLVTSDVAGTAMKSMPVDIGGVSIHRPGTIVGKALEPLDSGTGEILVLLSLQ